MNRAFPKKRQRSIPGDAFVVSDDSFPRRLGDLHKNDKWRKDIILWVTGVSHLILTANRPIQPIKSNATLTFQVFGLAVRIKESKDSSQTKTFPSAAGIGAGVT